MALNLLITADVLSCVITWKGRMERKSPARKGLFGPSAKWVCAIFSTMVWAMVTNLKNVWGQPPPAVRRAQFGFSPLAPKFCLPCLGLAPGALRLLLHVRFHQRHQLAERVAVFQIPDCLFQFFLRSGREHALGERGELLLHFLIGQRVSRIALREVKLLREHTS